jgi:hypothetical protein
LNRKGRVRAAFFNFQDGCGTAAKTQSVCPQLTNGAKRLGLRQPSGALERGNVNSGCRRGNLPRRNLMDVPERGCPHPQRLRQN